MKDELLFKIGQSVRYLRQKDGISQESAFQKVHSQDNIKAKKRLYMSATPKIFSESAKGKADKDNEVELYSMDNEEIFGSEAYNLKFDKALFV